MTQTDSNLIERIKRALVPVSTANLDGPWYINTGSSGSSSGSGQVEGTVAAGATDSTNPVKTGGKFNTTPPTLTDGQRGDTQLDSTGATIFNPKPLSSAFDSVSAVQGTSPYTVGGFDELAATQTITTDTHGNQVVLASVALWPTKSENNPSGAVTTVTLTFPNLTATGVAFDIQFATIIIENRLTTQTVNALTLEFIDAINVNNAVIDYQVPSVSLASGTGAGSVGIYTIPINRGKTKTVKLIVGFAAGVSAGTISAQVLFSATPQDIPVGSQVQGVPAVITDNSAHSVIAANALTLLRLNLTDLLVTNSHASTGTLVTFTAGAGGTALIQGYAAAAGGGWEKHYDVRNPLSLAVNTALSVICGTNSSSIYVSASGFWSA